MRHSREQTEETRARILSAASAVFVDLGYEGASLSAIAQKASVSKSLLIHHYGSKEELWDAVELSSFSRYAAEQLATVSVDLSGASFLRKSCMSYFRFLQQNPEYRGMLYWTQAERAMSPTRGRGAGVSQAVGTLIGKIASRVEDLQTRGEIRKDVDAKLLIASLLGVLREWFVLREDLYPDPKARAVADDEYVHTVVTLYWEGLKPEKEG